MSFFVETTAFTVVDLLVDFAADVGFLAVDLLTGLTAFLVAMCFPPYVKHGYSITQPSLCKHECYNELMALFIRQNEDRSKLQERLAAELQERAKQRAALDVSPDGVEDSEYMKNTKQSSSFLWVWFTVTTIIIVAVVWLVFLSSKQS